MESFQLEETKNSPKIILDADKHFLEFEGDSRPEDVQKFYIPVFNWLEKYNNYLNTITNEANKAELTCNFKFEYFNSSSAKYIMDIVNKIGEIDDNNSNIGTTFNWYYDDMDEDMYEAGKEFEEMVNAKFNYLTTE